MAKNSLIPQIILTICFVIVVGIFRRDTLTFRFDPSLIDRYWHSQDITHAVDHRIFLSDGDIYLATGYLYAGGSDPSLNNFEHPPVIKYLFGFASRLWGNPLVIQLLFGLGTIQLTYLLGKRITGSQLVGFCAALLLLIDPLFIDTLGQPLLDLGQTFFMLGYLFYMLYRPKNWLAQGVLLALFAGTKFWVTPLFFVAALAAYKWYKKAFDRSFFIHLVCSLFVYTMFYTQSFILQQGHFNLPWHMLKTLKYRFAHNTAAYFGASIVLFSTSFWTSWWNNSGVVRTATWSLLWPLGLIVATYQSLKSLFQTKVNDISLATAIPLCYLLFLGVEAPFPRYFLIILPFIYLALGNTLVNTINRYRRIAK